MSATAARPRNHIRTRSDADWCIIEQHQANPLLDLSTGTQLDITTEEGHRSASADPTSDSSEEGFSIVESTRPSFAQVASLKSAIMSVNPAPLVSPLPHVQSTTLYPPLSGQLRVADKYTEYKLKKSGKKYITVRS